MEWLRKESTVGLLSLSLLLKTLSNFVSRLRKEMQVQGTISKQFETISTSKTLSHFEQVFKPKNKYNFMVLFNLK
jgi:hypothetical protein